MIKDQDCCYLTDVTELDEMSVTLVGMIAVGLLIARYGNEATRCRGGAHAIPRVQ